MVDKYNWSGTDKKIAISLAHMSRMNFDVGVEDSPKMADYLSSRMAMPVILFDRPWNRNYVIRTDGSTVKLKGNDEIEMAPGDIFVIETPGGGGFWET